MKGRINMLIPDYQTIMLPLLQLAKDSKEHSLRGGSGYYRRRIQTFPGRKKRTAAKRQSARFL